jgi:hypothetical protein
MKLSNPVRLPARSKYRAVRTTIDGITFASKREAKRYSELKMLEKAGEIWDLQLQAKFALYVLLQHPDSDSPIGHYIADFTYKNRQREHVVEDSKGFRTPLYKWKKKHFEAQYGITIQEV